MGRSLIKKLRIRADLKMIRNIIIFIGLIVFTFWFLFKDQDMNELRNIIVSANDWFVLAGVGIMMLYFLSEAFNIKCVLKALGEKVGLLSCLKYTWIGFFFSAITPAASGGQPVEIYYMSKQDIPGPKATLALLIQLCGFQISTISLGVICAIINPSILNSGLIWLFLVGVLINSIALFFMLVSIFSKKITAKLVNFFVWILKKAKAKNIELKKKRIEDGLAKYNENAVFIKTHKAEFAKAILRVFIQICFYHSVPYFIYRAFGLNELSFFQLFTMQAVLYTTVSGLPLPGAIGVSESVFLGIFGVAFGTELLKGAMLLNRVDTFYLFVIISLIVVIINAIRMKNVKGEIDKQVLEFDKLEQEDAA